MRRIALISAIILLSILPSCEGKQKSKDVIITVDVTKNYSPKKELILQDFMDVEYITLETNDDFINQGFVLDVGKETIIVINRVNDGNIFIYDRKGKALRKINHKGEGGEEYTNITGIILDENNREMFVNDHFLQKLVVYDLDGNFKRSFKYKEDISSFFFTDIFNYDNENLICCDQYNSEVAFVLISKQDGSITKEIKIPFKEKKFLHQRLMDEANNTEFMVSPGPYRKIIPYEDNWLLLELSSDTVYTLFPDLSLRPFLIRTPPIQSMDTESFLILRLLSDRYLFMETIKNIYDFDNKKGFPKTFFMYDKQEKAFSGYTVFNGDFLTKKEVYMSVTRPVNHEIESWYPLEAHNLVESYRKKELKGKLKEMAAELNEESNPVIMVIKHKK